jgi:hypothetical protein
MREGRIKNALENVLTVSRELQPQRVRLQELKTVLRTNEVEDLASQIDQVSPVQREGVLSSVSRRRSLPLRRSKIKLSKPLLDYKAVSQVEKPNLDVTSVPNEIAM